MVFYGHDVQYREKDELREKMYNFLITKENYTSSVHVFAQLAVIDKVGIVFGDLAR